MAKAKKQNIFISYFKNFNLKKLADLMMLAAAIILFVGIFTTNVVMTVGLAIYIAAALIAIFLTCQVLFSGINKRSPEFKSAVINVSIMGLILALAIFGLVYSIIA